MGILSGKVALVTGAAGGMGREHALLMAERGADVAVADIDLEGARDTAGRIRALGRRAEAWQVDMGDTSAVKAMVTAAESALDRIDILVNNAGHGQRYALADIGEDDFDRMMDVHVKGSFFCTQAVVPGMQARGGGSIINISSIWGQTGFRLASHYCGAKAALLGLTKAWAQEFAPWKIRVNAVAPGGVLSGGPLSMDTPEELAAKQEAVPLKRFCEPREMAYAVAFLVSDEADFITGQVLSVNGGQVIVGI
jgi:3-oxoacyl-[acyl-carrier protein] reductase